MKRFFLWIFLAFVLTSPGLAAETCIRSAPNGSALEVHVEASTNSPVIGGIRVGTCGIRVTNQCDGSMCVVVLSGLNGWVEMTHVANSPVVPPALSASASFTGTLVYAVTGGNGTVTAAGVTQPTPVEATGDVKIAVSGPNSAVMTLPYQVTNEQIALSGKGTGPWTGRFGSWGGMPMPVTATLNGLGRPSATLVLKGNNQIASMEITLDLSARSRPQATRPATPPPVPAETSQVVNVTPGAAACRHLDRITKTINSKASTKQVQDLRGIYVESGLVTVGSSPGERECKKALDLIAMQPDLWQLAEREAVLNAEENLQTSLTPETGQVVSGSLPAVPSSRVADGTNSQLTQACTVLQPLVSPLLRGQSQGNREQALRILSVEGIVSVSNADPSQCALVLAGLMNAGLVANDGIPWASLAKNASRAGSGEPAEDMIAGGREIGMDPSDFIPEFNPLPQQARESGTQVSAAANTQSAVFAATADQPCILLGDAMVIAIRIGFSDELSTFADILKTHGVATLASHASKDCASALAAAKQAGLAR